jgi:methyl-accepting chemotaxis protein
LIDLPDEVATKIRRANWVRKRAMLASLGISTRIYVGFAVVLALLAGLAIYTFTSMTSVTSVFTEYRATARDSLTVNEMNRDLSQARMAAMRWRLDPNERDAAALDTLINEMLADIDTADERLDPDLVDEVRAATGLIAEYEVSFDEVVELQAERNGLVARMSDLGPRARQNLTDIMDSAYRDSDPEAAYYAGRAQESLLLGRFYAERFLLSNSQEAFDESITRLGDGAEGLASLAPRLQNPRRRQLAEEASALLVEYRDTLSRVRDVINNRNERLADMDRIGPELAADYGAMLEQTIDEQNTLGPQASAQISNTRSVSVWLGIGAVVLGLALAFLIGRWIAGAVSAMASDMSRMAGGDLDIRVTGDEHKHELGAMARALKVFQDNGREKLRLDAEAHAKAEADAKAAAERARLQEDVAKVVDRAAAGDFKSRVEARYADENLNAFAGQLNSLIEAVASGIGETARVMEALAGGNLTAQMQGDFRGAFAELQANVNTTVTRLSETVLDIQRVSANVGTATGEIAAGASDLSSRAENQAASLEQIAATMEQMSATVKTNAENASSAMSLATEASGRADKGGGVVSEAVTAMASIQEGSHKIADIVSVIDGFAFQTNLLALNAAVEAARAGEAGKGFAVVASEVRTLAQRSAEAARDIKGLIETSSGQVSDGVKLVEETGEALKEIVESIRRVSSTVTEISEASREQSSGVDEITAALTAMDETTQQNSALADESANAARGLNDQAARLRDRVAFFTVEARAGHGDAWDQDAAEDAAEAAARKAG